MAIFPAMFAIIIMEAIVTPFQIRFFLTVGIALAAQNINEWKI